MEYFAFLLRVPLSSSSKSSPEPAICHRLGVMMLLPLSVLMAGSGVNVFSHVLFLFPFKKVVFLYPSPTALTKAVLPQSSCNLITTSKCKFSAVASPLGVSCRFECPDGILGQSPEAGPGDSTPVFLHVHWLLCVLSPLKVGFTGYEILGSLFLWSIFIQM